jgi:hypothetical protein
MKYVLTTFFVLMLAGPALADTVAGKAGRSRIADASDVCIANCSSGNASCKRLCPTTYNVPCLSACDNQAQACMQSCQPRR